jgi:DNA modification methylase
MKPYYEHAGITIYHGDCREVIEQWEGLRVQSFDLLLTDPPYGIGASAPKRGGRQDGASLAASRDYGTLTWDDQPADAETIARVRAIAKHQIIFGGNYFALPPSRCWLVWDKQNGDNCYADCELAWTNFDKAVRRLSFQWMGMFTEPGCPKEYREHPTQKPEPVMRWAMLQAPEDCKTLVDPFMGSGTTLVAAKRLGRQCVGIEREEKYCEVAANRLAQEVLPLEMA